MRRFIALAAVFVACSQSSSPSGPSREVCVEGMLNDELGRPATWTDREREQCLDRYFGNTESDSGGLGISGRPLTVTNTTGGYIVKVIVDDVPYVGNPVLVPPGESWVMFIEDRPRSIWVIWADGTATRVSVSSDWEAIL